MELTNLHQLSELDHVFFLDLEETLVQSWEEPDLLQSKCARVAHAMREAQKDLFPGGRVLMGLMSWAVYHDVDKRKFNREFRPGLEQCLGRNFDDPLVWSMDDWCKQVTVATRTKCLKREDLFDLYGKHEVLFSMRNHPQLKRCRVTLVDDKVDHNCTVLFGNFRLTFLNVDKGHW